MIFQLGDRVEARLEEVDLMTRRITFSLDKRQGRRCGPKDADFLLFS